MDLTIATRILDSQHALPRHHADPELVNPAELRLMAARLVLLRQPTPETPGAETLPGCYVAPGNRHLGWGVKTNGNWTSTGEIFWAVTRAEAVAWLKQLLHDAAQELTAQGYVDRWQELRRV